MEKESKKKKYLLFLIVLTVFQFAASFAHPVTPTLIVERNLDSSMFGIALAAMMVMNFLFSPLWGKLCGYIPTRTIMAICGIGYAVGQTIFGSTHSEVMVVAGRMFAGIFTGGAWTAFANYVVNVSEPEERGRNLTIYATLQNVGGAVGYFIGGLMGLVSVEFTFTCQVIVLAAGGLLMLAVCEDDTPYKAKPDHKLTAKEANPFKAFKDAGKFMTPTFAMIFIIIAISAIGQNSFEQAFNFYIKDQFKLSSVYNGIFKAAIAGFGMLANTTVCMYLVKKTDVNKSFVPVSLISILPLGLILLCFDNVLPFAVCDIVFFTINTVRLTLMQNVCAKRATPETSNAVMGFNQSMNSLGGIFGAAFAGLIYEANTHYPFTLAFIAFVIAGAVAMLFLGKYRKEQE